MITTNGPANAEIARIFREVADQLELTHANQFRIRAYRNAARTVEESARSVASIARSTPHELEELPGIGADLAGKIGQIVRTGTLPMLATLERRAPKGATELMHVPGSGPSKARVLSQRLHVRSLEGLKRAAREGRIHKLRGFGAATEQRILTELATPMLSDRRWLRALEEMTEAAREAGYTYIAVTDHTPTVRIAGGLDRAGFRRQIRRIDKLNAKLHDLTILKGAEVDVHADGSLDLDDQTLAAFDIVIVSLHSSLALSPERQTQRITRALRNPFVNLLGHPTGRLISRRHGARFDLDEVCRVASGEGVVLEINAQPERLDLDDISARRAIERGDVVNTFPLEKLLKTLRARS